MGYREYQADKTEKAEEEMIAMLYKFSYFYEKEGEEFFEEIEAENDRDAVEMFKEISGDCEFSCIKEDGTYFTDDDER